MADLTVTAEPIELVSDDGITVYVGGTVTITGAGGGGSGTVDVVSNVAQDRILGRVSSGSGDSEELTASQVRTLLSLTDENVQDLVGAMAGDGLTYDDAAGTIDVTQGRPIVTAPADGTHTYVTATDGVLPLVLVQPSTNGVTEDGRAHIILPDPADHLGESVTVKTLFAPTLIPNRLGATIGAMSTTPGVLGDLATWVASNPPLNWASSPLTIEITVNGTPYEVVLDEDYAAAGLIGQAIAMQLILAGAPVVLVDHWHLTTDDTEPSNDAGDVLTLAMVTATQGAGSSIEITDAGVGDPLGLLAETTSYPGADTGRILWGVDRSLLMAGHGNTHHCADGGTDPTATNVAAHQSVTLVAVSDALGAYWGGIGESMRAEYVTFDSTTEWFGASVNTAAEAIDELAAAVDALETGGGGGGATNLDGLSDVTITSAASGDILRHNGTAWVDAAGIVGTDITSGTVPTARLGSGSASASTFLRGDQSWAAPTVDAVSNVATRRIVGRTTSGSGDSEELTPNQLADLLGVDSGAPAVLSGARQYQLPGRRPSGILTTVTLAADRLYLLPIVFSRDWSCTALGFGVSTAVAGTTARIALWAADSGWQGSGAPLMESGDISTASTGWKRYAPGSAVTGNAGNYLIGVCATGAITLRGALIPAADIDAAVVAGGTNTSSILQTLRRLTHTGGTAMPSSPTWDTVTATSGQTDLLLAVQWGPQ